LEHGRRESPLVEERLRISHSTLGVALFVMAAGALIAMPLAGPSSPFRQRHQPARVATPLLLTAMPLTLLVPGPTCSSGRLLLRRSERFLDVSMNAHGVTVERRYGRSEPQPA
jgi:hypothetical protein